MSMPVVVRAFMPALRHVPDSCITLKKFRGCQPHACRYRHSWPAPAANLYDGCDDSSPHPYCKSNATADWTKNFRNFALHPPVRFCCLLSCKRLQGACCSSVIRSCQSLKHTSLLVQPFLHAARLQTVSIMQNGWTSRDVHYCKRQMLQLPSYT
jgi:hypothetical protein